jgi:pimeloyl-ACP methyl ester carboxylesterase
MQDYGVPIGFHLIAANPEAVTSIIVQNGVIHLDGFAAAQDENGELRRHWRNRDPAIDARRAAYMSALKYPARDGWSFAPTMSPDAILLMTASAQRPGVTLARNDLWFDYGNNLKSYPAWQKLLQKTTVPVLVLWGSRDTFFTYPGAVAYLRDQPKAELHIFDGDHFATLQQPDIVSPLLADFIARHREALSSGRKR